MSKANLPTFQTLEDRRLMAVGPLSIPNATVNDTAYDAENDVLHVVYFDAQSKTLKHLGTFDDTINIPGGAALLAPSVIDATEGTGQYLSTALGSDGILHVAYYDAKNGDLKYARRDTAGVWSTTTVDSKNTVGLYPSIVLDRLNQPNIAYYSKTGGNLKVARGNGTSWNIRNIDTTGDVGRYASIAVNPNAAIEPGGSRLGIAYEDSTNGDFKYVEVTPTRFTVPVTVDASTTKGGGYISLAFNNGQPAFSYYDAANADLKYAARSDNGKWSHLTVAANNSQGLYTDLQFTFDTNQPAIVYYNKTSDRVMLAYRRPDRTWVFEPQVTGGGSNVSAADGPIVGNNPPELYLAYTDTASGNLVINTF
jgi:hypothetical protein